MSSENFAQKYFNQGKEMVNQYYEGISATLNSAEAVVEKIEDAMGKQYDQFKELYQGKNSDTVEFTQKLLDMMRKNHLLLLDMSQQAMDIFLKGRETFAKEANDYLDLKKRIEELEKQISEIKAKAS